MGSAKTTYDSKFLFTPEGGMAVQMTNRTGAPSVKGSVVSASTAYDCAFRTSTIQYDMIGVVYESGIPDGGECYVVTNGIAECLIENTYQAKAGFWVRASTVAGYATPTTDPGGLSALAADEHWKEIGHCLETKSTGTNVLAKVLIHFN